MKTSNSPRVAIFQESEKRLSDVVGAVNERYSGFKTFLNYSGTPQIQKNSILVERERTHSMQSLATGGLVWFSQQRGWVFSVNVRTALCIVEVIMYWITKRLYFAFSFSVLELLFTNGRSMKRAEKNVGHVS